MDNIYLSNITLARKPLPVLSIRRIREAIAVGSAAVRAPSLRLRCTPSAEPQFARGVIRLSTLPSRQWALVASYIISHVWRVPLAVNV